MRKIKTIHIRNPSVKVPAEDWTNNILNVIITDTEYNIKNLERIISFVEERGSEVELEELRRIYDPEDRHSHGPNLPYIRYLIKNSGINDNFRNYILVKQDADIDHYESYTLGHSSIFSYPGPTCDWFDCEGPENEAELTELQDAVAEEIHDWFENPRIRSRTEGIIFQREIREEYMSSIYPYNTILVADRILEEPVVSALNYLGIEKKLHYSPWQPSLF